MALELGHRLPFPMMSKSSPTEQTYQPHYIIVSALDIGFPETETNQSIQSINQSIDGRTNQPNNNRTCMAPINDDDDDDDDDDDRRMQALKNMIAIH
jgi:hypothetical protein